MTPEKIIELIQGGEKIDVEFKESKTAINKDVYSTVCAFNNRIGGHLILGVNDSKEIIGVDPAQVDALKKDFTTSVNNPQKIYPPLYLSIESFEINHKTVLYVYVPEGKTACRHNGKFYDRSHEGDIDITNNMELVFKLLARKQAESIVDKVYPNFSVEDLDANTIDKARKLASIRNQQHPWLSMGNEELLRSVNLILLDPETKKEGITLAAILLFGSQQLILSVLPCHKTDAIFRVVNVDRYDDRDVILSNLIDSYDRLMEFGKKHLNDLFVLDGIISVSARDHILREIISNTLAHRDYSSRFPARIVITADAITVENSNLAHGYGELELSKFKPFSKNPSISKVFREIGLADELGSGMRNTYKYTMLYSQTEPIFEEGDIFKTIIPLTSAATIKVGGNALETQSGTRSGTRNGTRSGTRNGTQNSEETIIHQVEELIRSNNSITREEISQKLNIGVRSVTRYVKKIPKLSYVGKGKNGHWEFEE